MWRWPTNSSLLPPLSSRDLRALSCTDCCCVFPCKTAPIAKDIFCYYCYYDNFTNNRTSFPNGMSSSQLGFMTKDKILLFRGNDFQQQRVEVNYFCRPPQCCMLPRSGFWDSIAIMELTVSQLETNKRGNGKYRTGQNQECSRPCIIEQPCPSLQAEISGTVGSVS